MKTPTKKHMTQLLLLLAILFLGNSPTSAATRFEGAFAVSSDHLDSMRGGYVTGDMTLSLGIKGLSMIDGVMQTVYNLQISDMAKLGKKGIDFPAISFSQGVGPDKATSSSTATTALAPTSVPAGGVLPQSVITHEVPGQSLGSVEVPAGALQAGSGTVILQNGFSTLIQNNVDQRIIQHQTIIDATVSNADLFRDMQLVSRINEQLINAMH